MDIWQWFCWFSVLCTVEEPSSSMDCVSCEDVPPSPPPYSTLYIEQQLDHFNYFNNAVWRQKYLLSEIYWQGKGPLFFYTGNEEGIETFYNNTGFLFTLAGEFNAIIVFAEHRYYGDSLPFGAESFSKSNLGYLSVEQALADFAVLVQNLKKEYPGISKVITFGGSYGGMLSAWFRMKYPNIVDGALAASAPIALTSEDEGISRTALYEKVTKDFAAADANCPVYVREGFSMIDQLATEGDSGLYQLTQYFNLCDPLREGKVQALRNWISDSFFSMAMANYPYPTNLLMPLPAHPVKMACQIMSGASNPAVGLAQAVGLAVNDASPCVNMTCDQVACGDGTSCVADQDISWDYQVCTEIKLTSDTNGVTDMFSPHTYDPGECCWQTYGVKYQKYWMETQYWGMDLRSASNIIFSNGDLDPWSVGGVTFATPVPDSVTKIFIEEGAHHSDLRFADARDPVSVTVAREREKVIIQHWLQS